MDAHQFLALAESLAASAKADPAPSNVLAMRRSAISRAYYALFLVAPEFVDGLGIETRLVPSLHVTLEHGLRNSGVFSRGQIANTIGFLRTERANADYEMRRTDVETPERVDSVVESARAAILQLDLIRAGRLSPPLDRAAVAAAILKWAGDNGKPLWRKA